MKSLIVILFLSLAFSIGHGQASAAPSPETVQKVVDHYLYGADDGPVLFRIQLCAKVDHRKGPEQFSCLVPASTPIKVNSQVFTVLSFLVPMNSKVSDVVLQYLWKDQIRNTHDLNLQPSLRYFTVTEETFSKPGTWEVRISKSGKVIGSTQIQVQ